MPSPLSVHPAAHGEVVTEQFSITASHASGVSRASPITASQAEASSGTEGDAVSIQVATVPLNKCVFSGQDKLLHSPKFRVVTGLIVQVFTLVVSQLSSFKLGSLQLPGSPAVQVWVASSQDV